jgi:hypothetical protein
MPATSSEDRLAQVTQDLIAVLKQPHPNTPFLHEGDQTSDAMRQLTTIFRPPQRNATHDMVPSPRVLETTQEPPRVLRSDVAARQSPRVLEQEINTGTKIKKKFGKNIFTGTVTAYNSKAQLYYVEYSDGDSEEMIAKEVQQYKCTTNHTAVERLRSRKAQNQANAETQKTYTVPLPQHFAHAVWDDESGRMLEFRHLLNH